MAAHRRWPRELTHARPCPSAFPALAAARRSSLLPALWLLLRVTPPAPRRIEFPPLQLILDLMPRGDAGPHALVAAVLRLAMAALLILALAGPV